MLRNVFLKSLRDQRRALLWWGIGLVALAVITLLFYPSIRDTTELDELYDRLPEALAKAFVGEFSDFTSPEGFINTQLLFFFAPFLFLVFTIARGSGAIAGEEERGTLDLLLCNPLSRSRVVAEKFGAMVIATLTLAFTLWLGLTIGAVAVGMDISLVRMAEAMLSLALLGLAFGALALALGCATGSRGLSMGLASALAAVSYLWNALTPSVAWLEPYQKLSSFYHFVGTDPLTNGLHLGYAGLLIAQSLVLLAVALITFNRRDLAV